MSDKKYYTQDNSLFGAGYGYGKNTQVKPHKESNGNWIYAHDKPAFESSKDAPIDIFYGLNYESNRRKEKTKVKAEKKAQQAEKVKAEQEDTTPKLPDGIITCDNCQKDIQDQDYCPECGYLLHPVKCTHCEEIVPEGEFCAVCGKYLSRVKEIARQAYLYVAEQKYRELKFIKDGLCPECYHPMGKEKRCAHCGYFNVPVNTEVGKPKEEVQMVECPNCLENVKGEGNCSNCGWIFDMENKVECPNCLASVDDDKACSICGYYLT